RIVPLYWLLNLAAAAIYFAMPSSAPAAVAPTGRGLAVVMLFGQAWPPFRHILDFNYPSWSLSTELFFYALFPFVILMLHRRSIRALLSVGGLLLAAYLIVIPLLWLRPVPTLYPANMLAFPPLQLLKFTVGVCLGLALRKGWRPTLQPGTALALLIAAVALIPALSTSWVRAAAFRASEIFPDMIVTVPVVLLIIAAAAADLREQRGVGSARSLVRLGDWSFAMYLVHAPLLIALNAVRISQGWLQPPGLGWLTVYLIVVITVAGALHHWFELPLERLLRGRRRLPSITND
ncbi:MAG: acyltransferase family protein, partial [Nakamurella sp.]